MRVRLNDDQRRRLAVKGKVLGRRRLAEVCSIVTPDTILRWHRRLIAQKYDGSARRRPGRPRAMREIARLVVRMARRIRCGAMAVFAENSNTSVIALHEAP
jgi:putative transposase